MKLNINADSRVITLQGVQGIVHTQQGQEVQGQVTGRLLPAPDGGFQAEDLRLRLLAGFLKDTSGHGEMVLPMSTSKVPVQWELDGQDMTLRPDADPHQLLELLLGNSPGYALMLSMESGA